MDSRNISLLTHQNACRFTVVMCLEGGKKPFICQTRFFFSPCININSRVSQQFSSCHSCVYGLMIPCYLNSAPLQSSLQYSHRLSKPFGIINPHGPGCPLFSYIPLSLPVISWYVKQLMVLSQYLLHHAGATE